MVRVENPNPGKPEGFELSSSKGARLEKTSGFDLLKVGDLKPGKPEGFEVATGRRSRQEDDPPAILVVTPLLNMQTTAG